MDKKKISFYVPVEVLDRLDRIAEVADMDRTRLMVNILDEMSKTLLSTKKVGLLQISVLLRDLSEWGKKVAKQTKFKGIETS
jgi:hypothetical protein